MLDQKDLQAIAELMDCRISKTEEKMIKEMNARVSDVETGLASLSNRIDEVETSLTERIDNVEASLSERIDNVETTLNNKIEAVDKRVSEVETNLTNKIQEVETGLTNKITEVESFLTKELVRTEDILTRRMNKMSSKLEEIGEYYRVEKLENGNMGMVLQMLESYNARLKKLEMGFA
jgi:hypothetical protein